MINSLAAQPPSRRDDDGRLVELKTELHANLIESIDVSLIKTMDEHTLRRELRRGAEELCQHKRVLLSQSDRDKLVDEIVNETLGLGPLEPLMHDPTVSDILINGPDLVFVERRGQLETTNVRFRDEQHLLDIVQRIASRVGRRVDESSPMVDARLPDGSRVNAVIRPLALDGALVSIRRFSQRPLMAGDLIAHKAATKEMLDFLAACVRARLNIVISGGTGSGKTTLLNMLSGYIGSAERIATIEDAAELQLQQRHVARMETRPPNLEDTGEVTARDLLRNSLRMRPDRIIVGECRGCEAFEMLQAMSTGHDGSLTTIHANDTRDAINRLEMLVGTSDANLPIWFIHRQIASAIQIVVQTARLAGGSRKVVQISEITGMEGDSISMHDLFAFHTTGVDAEGRVEGFFSATGLRPHHIGRISAAGVALPLASFERRSLEIDRVDEYSRGGATS